VRRYIHHTEVITLYLSTVCFKKAATFLFLITYESLTNFNKIWRATSLRNLLQNTNVYNSVQLALKL